MARHSIDERKLQAIDNLPTLPTVATQLLEMLGRMEVSMQEISRLMEVDPAITAQILKIANSAYYGLRIKVDTVPRALVVLGVNEITNIILSLSLFKSFPSVGAADFDRKVFWSHSAVVGFLCRFLAQEFNVPTHGEEFTAGLMHDIGKIVVDQHFHAGLLEVVARMSDSGRQCWEVEREVLGLSHAEVGAFLGRRWEIPGNILEAVLLHHQPATAAGDVKLTALVHLADVIAVRGGYHQAYNRWQPELSDSTAWELLGVDAAAIDWTALDGIIERQIEKAAEFISVTLPKMGG